MKALYIQDLNDGSLVLYGHDLNDQLVETLVAEFQAQDKYAFAVDQIGSHGGAADSCEKCRQAGEKIAGGTVTSYRFTSQVEANGSLDGDFGMVSSDVDVQTSFYTKLAKPVRVILNVIPYLLALTLIAYGMVYFLRTQSGSNGELAGSPLAAAQTTPDEMLAAPTDLPLPTATLTPSPSPTSLPTPTEVVPTPTEEPAEEAAPACVDALSITAEDAGKTLCITGIVHQSQVKNDVFSIFFSKDWGNFYVLSYDRVWDRAVPGACIQMTGEIVMSGTIPVIVFGYQNELSLCP